MFYMKDLTLQCHKAIQRQAGVVIQGDQVRKICLQISAVTASIKPHVRIAY